MIGFSIALSNTERGFCLNYEKTELHHNVIELLNTPKCYIGYSYHNTYPVKTSNIKGWLVIFEGAIYNFEESKIIEQVVELVDNREYGKLADNIINVCDGDYNFYLYNAEKNITVIINDFMGRLPLYYHYKDGLFLASRKLNFMLANISSTSFSKTSIDEYLTYEFIHDSRSLFDNINKLEPANLLIFDGAECSITNTIKLNFDDDSFIPSSDVVAEEYILSTQSRANYFISRDNKIISTLSGGFDSRAVFGCLSKFTDDVDYITYQYFQDESAIAKELIATQINKSRFTKLNIENNAEIENDDLLLKTSGLINCFTNSICYNDLLSMYKEFPDAILFGGFGGEFFRHPYYSTLRSVESYIRNLINPFKNAFNTNTNNNFYVDYPEKTKEGKFKRLYYEYYKNYVVGAGEERYRLYYWTVQPLMSLKAVKYFISLSMTRKSDYNFFCNIIENIDSKLTLVDIYGDNTNLLNKKYWDFKSSKLKIYPYIVEVQSIIRKVLNRNSYACEISEVHMLDLLKSSNLKGFDQELVMGLFFNSTVLGKRRLYTIIRYLSKIQDEFNSISL